MFHGHVLLLKSENEEDNQTFFIAIYNKSKLKIKGRKIQLNGTHIATPPIYLLNAFNEGDEYGFLW